jgi:hypothetical protein
VIFNFLKLCVLLLILLNLCFGCDPSFIGQISSGFSSNIVSNVFQFLINECLLVAGYGCVHCSLSQNKD